MSEKKKQQIVSTTMGGLVASAGKPLTMNKLQEADNFGMAQTVVAFSDKNQKKLLSISKKELDKNPHVALFAILCWFYREAHKNFGKADETITSFERSYKTKGDEDDEGESDDSKKGKKLEYLSGDLFEVLRLFVKLCKDRENIDTKFFEQEPKVFFTEVYQKLTQAFLQDQLEDFYARSYTFGKDEEDSNYKFRDDFVFLQQVFLERNFCEFKKPQTFLEKQGEWFLDQIMSFVYSKEHNRNGARNRIARFKAYHLFLIVFLGNDIFPEKVRVSWMDRYKVWGNVEEYLYKNSKLFEKKTKLLGSIFPKLITFVQQDSCKNPTTLDEVIKNGLVGLKVIV